MRTVTQSIASIAVCLVYSLAAAEPAFSNAGGQGAVPSVFADSFGLNLAVSTAALKPPGALPSPGPAWTPAADSFGLNHRLISNAADCLAADAPVRPQPDQQRCIRM